jgi:hypothetical protein
MRRKKKKQNNAIIVGVSNDERYYRLRFQDEEPIMNFPLDSGMLEERSAVTGNSSGGSNHHEQEQGMSKNTEFSKFSLNNTCNLESESMRSTLENDFDGDVAELKECKAKVDDPLNLLADPVLKRKYELLRSVGEEYVTDRELVALLKRKPDSFGASNRVADNENASVAENANEDTIGMSEPIFSLWQHPRAKHQSLRVSL